MINLFNSYKFAYAYSLSDILKYGLSQLSPAYTADYPKATTAIFTRAIFASYGVNAPSTSIIPAKYLDETHVDLINGIIERYWDEFVLLSEENMEDPTQILSYPDILYKVRRFLGKLIDLINFTYPKYAAILSSYDSKKTHLLDQMNKSISGNDTRRDNDTPQDGGEFDDDNHTSFISQGEVSNEENWDDTPIIERLDKISKLYEQTKRKWLDEFKDLFIEGGNIHYLHGQSPLFLVFGCADMQFAALVRTDEIELTAIQYVIDVVEDIVSAGH